MANQFDVSDSKRVSLVEDALRDPSHGDNSSFREQVINMLMKGNTADSLPLGKVRELADAARNVSDRDVHLVALDNEGKSADERKTAATIYSEAAVLDAGHNDRNTVNQIAAARLSDPETARKDLEHHVIDFDTNGRNEKADAVGLVAGFAAKWGAEKLLNLAEKQLPMPAPLKVAVAVGTGLVVGGLVNNEVGGRELLNHKGFLNNGLLSGGVYLANEASSLVFDCFPKTPYSSYLNVSTIAGGAGLAMGTEGSRILEKAALLKTAWHVAEPREAMELKYVVDNKSLLTSPVNRIPVQDSALATFDPAARLNELLTSSPG